MTNNYTIFTKRIFNNYEKYFWHCNKSLDPSIIRAISAQYFYSVKFQHEFCILRKSIICVQKFYDHLCAQTLNYIYNLKEMLIGGGNRIFVKFWARNFLTTKVSFAIILRVYLARGSNRRRISAFSRVAAS